VYSLPTFDDSAQQASYLPIKWGGIGLSPQRLASSG
jgi:hypothetical protein